jgi:hypothetical protein
MEDTNSAPAGNADSKQQIKLEIPYSEKVSRLFIFRGFWVFIMIWPMYLLMFWVLLLGLLHFFHMLFLGKRHQTLWEHGRKFFVWLTEWQAYFNVVVDKRPGFWW